MLFNMVVSLYTSRVILNVLGVEDFGIYNVVAGVITMFSFINGSMAGATSRFLTYELGLKENRITEVFRSSITIHTLIAIIVLILAETIGLWFFETKLVIPADKMFAARCLYQMAIVSALLTIFQVPFTATIIANERMNIYAIVEMINTTLKMVVVFLLLLTDKNKLLTYGFLIGASTFIITFTYFLYCRIKFDYCKIRFMRQSPYLKKMLFFSGWDLYGNVSVIARTQGVNMLLNMFFSVAMNASSGVATQVQSAVMNFASNVVLAFRPQIIKEYASNNYKRVNELINSASLYTFILLAAISIPLIIEMENVLNIWLGVVPEYSVEFCRLTLAFNFMANFSSIILIGIHATGNIKRPSIVNGTLYLLVIPITYFAFKYGVAPWVPYVVNVIAVATGVTINSFTLHKYIGNFSLKQYYGSTIVKSMSAAVLSTLIGIVISRSVENIYLSIISTTTVVVLFLLIYTYVVCMSVDDRVKLIKFCKSKVVKNGQYKKTSKLYRQP